MVNTIIGHCGKYHDTLCFSPKTLHKGCFQFPLGLTMVPRENKNNAYAKFGGTNKEYYGIFRTGLFQKLVTMVVCGKSLLVLWYRRTSLGRFLFKYRLSTSWIFLIFTVFFFCETCGFSFFVNGGKIGCYTGFPWCRKVQVKN